MKQTLRASILCVESNAAARERLAGFLTDYDCSFACNAYEAIKQLHTRGFDAHVLDYWMPDWSGPLLCREIRKLDPHCPVMFCTEAMSTVQRGKALRAGASAYLPKPVDPNVLLTKLRALLTFAESESLRATRQAERALREELIRRGVAAATIEGTAQALARSGTAASSIERTAHARSRESFIDSGGTRVQFERWWAHTRDATFAVSPTSGILKELHESL